MTGYAANVGVRSLAILETGVNTMGKKYKLGVIGFAHMHVVSLMAEFAELSNVEWVACADTKPAVPSLPN